MNAIKLIRYTVIASSIRCILLSISKRRGTQRQALKGAHAPPDVVSLLVHIADMM